MARVDGEGLESALDHLEGVGALKIGHAGLDFWIDIVRQAADLNCDKVMGDE
jgi:hypothetical protein